MDDIEMQRRGDQSRRESADQLIAKPCEDGFAMRDLQANSQPNGPF
jgi:hypothetical protein